MSDSPPSPPAPARTRSAPPPITVEDFNSPELARSVPLDSTATPSPGVGSNDPIVEDRASREVRRPSTWHPWHHRHKSPGVEWHDKLTKESFTGGRVLLVDYVSKEHTQQGRRRIVAQEFCNLDGLRKFYSNQGLAHQAALRVIHVQSAPWATRYLLRKFNIDHHDDLVGTAFGRWAKYDRPQRRAGKPVLNGKTFRTQRDPWRGISRTAFGLDYLKQYEPDTAAANPDDDVKMMELNGYTEHEYPNYALDVFVQRLSVYVQRKEEGAPVQWDWGDDGGLRNPYNEEEYESYQRWRKKERKQSVDEGKDRYVPRLKTLDNGNTIIIFEHSHTGTVDDTLIGARQEIESRWRRLTFYLSREEVSSDERLAVQCMEMILKDVFKALAISWEKYLACCATHVSILEDKIYESPADESRAPELWTNASLWLKVEKLMYIHIDIIKEMRSHIKELVDDNDLDDWFESTLDEFDKLSNTIQEDLIKPTAALSDLMYKSVEIRDSRQSLQLGTSMWRLSWITFIFLPLTFIVGFFGMNVNIFDPVADIKWYFIAAIPLMFLVILLWYVLKYSLAKSHQDPLRRGVYEALYHDLAIQHPRLWTRNGPRDTVVPSGFISNLKWRLLTYWFSGDKILVSRRGFDTGEDELGVWSRCKRALVRRWLSTITVAPSSAPGAQGDPLIGSGIAELGEAGLAPGNGAVTELLSLAQPIAVAGGEPAAVTASDPPVPLGSRSSHARQGLSYSLGRNSPVSSAAGSGDELEREPSAQSDVSGIMVDEKAASTDDESGAEDRKAESDGSLRGSGRGSREAVNRGARRKSSGSARQSFRGTAIGDRLSVPLFPGRASEQSPEWD